MSVTYKKLNHQGKDVLILFYSEGKELEEIKKLVKAADGYGDKNKYEEYNKEDAEDPTLNETIAGIDSVHIKVEGSDKFRRAVLNAAKSELKAQEDGKSRGGRQ